MNIIKYLVFKLAQAKPARRLILPLLLASLASNSIQAIGLGTIQVDSIFGEPFAGSVEVFNTEGYDENSIIVRIASRAVHEELGIIRAPYLDEMQVELVFNERGTAEIRVTGQTPIQEPYMELALEMSWPEGRIVRDYTVLLNMPSSTAPLRQVLSPEPVTQKSISIPHSSVYTLERGDTLSQVAERLEGREVSLADAIETLRAHNTSLVESRGTSGLLVGDKLRIPAKEIFSLPPAPVQAIAAASSTTSSSNTQTNVASATADASRENTIGSPLANAETRLRALGYTNLQLQANGETPNPIVASGAAANILERLIAEQSEDDRSYGTSQIGRLAEGLNEVSSISRAFQERLALAGDTANENDLATAAEQTAAVPSLPAETIAQIPLEESERPLSNTPSLAEVDTGVAIPIAEPSKASGVNPLFGWLLGLLTLVLIFCGIWAAKKRSNEKLAAEQSLFAPKEKGDAANDLQASDTLAESQEASSSSSVAEETDDDAANTATPNEDQEIVNEELEAPEAEEITPKVTAFYDEAVPNNEAGSDSATFNNDLDSELDEELKLISVFQESLASDVRRAQVKTEETIAPEASSVSNDDDFEALDLSSAPSDDGDSAATEFGSMSNDDGDISSVELISEEDDDEEMLDFNLSSLETEDELDFVLEDSDQTTAEILEISPADEAAEQVPAVQTPIAAANNYSGYAEAAGFSHINPVEVVEIVNNKLVAAKNAGQESTLFYIELDNYNNLESELGILRAEQLAATVASNIYDLIENPVTLKRFRQESFVLVLAGGQNQQNLQFGVELAKGIAATPMSVDNETYFVTLSIGIVPVASGFSNSAEIIEMAKGVAQQFQEENNGNGATLCELDPETSHNDASILRTGQTLLEKNAFVAFYQPVTALKGDPLEFYEARLKVAENHQHSSIPSDLVERLRSTDLSTEIDCAAVNQAVSELNDYAGHHVSTRVFIGISARTATDNVFKNWLEKNIFSGSIQPQRIVFQFTEESVSRYLNGLIEFRDYVHTMGSTICISEVDFEHIPEDALARLHPDYVKLSMALSLRAQNESGDNSEGLQHLTEVLERAQPLCEKTIVPGISQARIIPTLWPLAVDYIQGDYIQPASLTMDYNFEEVVP